MHTLTIKHKFHSGDIVYFLKENEVRKGIVSKVSFDIETVGFSDGYYVEKLFKKLITNFDKERKYKKRLRYQIDLLCKDKDEYYSTPHYFEEHQLFFNKRDLTDSL
jgi:hypothetical protein